MSFHFYTIHIIYGQVWKLILWGFEQPKTSMLLTSAGSGHFRTGALIPKSLWSKDLIKRSIYRRLKINASTSRHPCFYPCLSICWPRSLSLFPLQSPAWLWSPVALDSNFKKTCSKISFFMSEVQFGHRLCEKFVVLIV